MPDGVNLSANLAQPGDKILLSGTIGDHGIAILAQREGLEFESRIESDSAALHGLVANMLAVGSQVRCMRDPTRGGLSSTLNEIAVRAGVGIELIESEIPVRDEVRGGLRDAGPRPNIRRQ